MTTINLILDRLNVLIGIWFIIGFLIFVGLGLSRPRKFADMFREENFGHKIMLFLTGCFASPGICILVLYKHFFK